MIDFLEAGRRDGQRKGGPETQLVGVGLFEFPGIVIALPSKFGTQGAVEAVGGNTGGGDAQDGFDDRLVGHDAYMLLGAPILFSHLIAVLASRGRW